MDTVQVNSGPPLKDLQRWFNWAVIDQTKAEPVPSCGEYVVGRTQIYQNAYVTRIAEALQADFKVLNRAMGADVFASLAARYLLEYPSSYFNISDVGKNLGMYLKTTEFETEVPFLSDLAELEWALIESFWAESRDPISALTFSGLTESEVAQKPLILHPSVHVLSLKHAVHSIFSRFDEEDAVFFDPPKEEPTYLLIYRVGPRSRFEPITANDFHVLSLLKDRHSLDELSNQLEGLQLTSSYLKERFSSWIASRLICKSL